MKMMESITTFLHKATLGQRRSRKPVAYWGPLNRDLVQAQKPVIVFEHPKIIHSSDTVEEATTFLMKAKESGKVFEANIYRHQQQAWHKVEATLLSAAA